MLLFVAGKGRDFFLSFQENSLFKCTMFFFAFMQTIKRAFIEFNFTPPNSGCSRLKLSND